MKTFSLATKSKSFKKFKKNFYSYLHKIFIVPRAFCHIDGRETKRLLFERAFIRLRPNMTKGPGDEVDEILEQSINYSPEVRQTKTS